MSESFAAELGLCTRVCELAAVLFIILCDAAGANEMTVQFEPSAESTSFSEIKISERDSEGVPKLLDRDAEGKFHRSYILDGSHYFEFHSFVVELNKNKEISWPIPYQNIIFDINVILRDDDPSTITIPVEIPSRIGSKQLDALESAANEFELRGSLLQIGIMHGYFLSVLGENDSFTRRSAQMWFDAAYKLSASNHRRFFITNDTLESVLRSLPTNKERFQKSFDEASSLPLLEIGKIDRALSDADCKRGRSILTSIQSLIGDRPELLQTQRITSEQVEDREAKLRTCEQTGKPSPTSKILIGKEN